ncbi:D-glycero-beta-D-manno-heptose-7-phosphate kinase [Elusimicrobiota bacterium]
MEKKELLINCISKFKDINMLIIGDLILDKYTKGRVSRISPEAPVPVIEITKEHYVPGGAGNVVNNLNELGIRTYIGGVIGDDIFGRQLKDILDHKGSDTSGVFVDPNRPTSLKTRIIAEHQQVVRTDLESTEEISQELVEGLVEWIDRCINKVNGIVISDYGKGLITSELIKNVLDAAEGKNIPVVVDPQVGHFFEYKNVTSITPNLRETELALRTEIHDKEALEISGKRLLEELDSESVLITRGEHGMTLVHKDGTLKDIPAKAKEVYDVSGAGDTVVSVFTAGLTIGLDHYVSALLANYAAAVVVAKLGTATASIDELKKEIES